MTADWITQPVSWPRNPHAAVRRFADGGEVAWLDSAAEEAHSRYSLVCTQPTAVLSQHDGERATLEASGHVIDQDANFWDLWDRCHHRLPSMPRLDNELSPGWVGYLGFELARQLERLPGSCRETLGLPLGRIALYRRGILLDHATREARAVIAPRSAAWYGRLHASRDEPDADWLARWESVAGMTGTISQVPHVEIQPDWSEHEYRAAIGRAIEHIAAGDIYQVNIAQRFRLDGLLDAFDTYAAIRGANPAAYAALLAWSGGAIASASPELFLRLRGREVLTSPIKGTRPRTGNAAVDSVQKIELLRCEKERAELTMIVDLHRNDLGRVCAPGTVRVQDARRIEQHPTVFHTVADVVGRLRDGVSGIDLLRACFPAGSITGVPKIRAIEIINALEPFARGAYTGAVGVLGLDGRMAWNVAIRTLQMRGAAGTLYAGGGIVADSRPDREYEETFAKARGILRGLAPNNTTAPYVRTPS